MTTATVTSSMNTDIKFSPDLHNHRRHNWGVDEITLLFSLPLNDLLFKAQTIHRDHFNPNEVQVSTYYRSKQVPALKTVNTAPRVFIMTLA